MNFHLIQAVAALAVAIACPLLAHAAPIEQLPRVVVTGKSQPALQKVVQLPRVVIEGRSVTVMALNTTTQPVTRRA